MVKRALWLLPLLVIGCTGLFLENGNSYPCDFSLGPGKRDEACQAGDICGTNNVCQSFIYEGPRFEGQATLPEYGVASGEGALLHPLVLKGAANEVTAVLPMKSFTSFLRNDEGIFKLELGRLDRDPVMLPTLPPSFGTPTSYQPFITPPNLVQTNVIFRNDAGLLAIAQNGIDLVTNQAMPFASKGFRVLERSGPLQSQLVAWDSTSLGKVEQRLLPPMGFVYDSIATTPSAVFDVAGVSVPLRQWLLVLREDAIDLHELTATDAGVSLAASLDSLAMAQSGVLKTDPGSRVVAAVRRGLESDVLSTFQMNIGADGLTLSSPWPDCRPCRAGRLQMVAPSVRSGAPTVDVLCRTNELHAFRVVGSVALTQTEACITEPLDPSIELEQLVDTTDGVVSWNSQAGILLGGKSGEIWNGDSLTTLQPLFLDRVPLDVAPASTGATSSVAVITDQYLAVQQTPEILLPNEGINGFRRLAAADLEDSNLMGFIHGVNGWAITDQGELIGVSIDGGSPPKVVHSAQLVTANDEPIRSTIGGEGYLGDDGGLRAFFIAADDSLYFAPKPENPEEDVLVPVLTPEPSVPIRSLALERTPLGTNGVDAARGYLVTSRNLYSWALSGNPARWSSTPLLLSAGEPVEVWFDSARSALGRVGYRDGQIFSLPGGYPLAEPLPSGQVIDFENLGGWPVAYATTGLFIAGWDQVDGKLQNRFPNGVNKPMTWREVKIAGANPTPWMHPPLGAEGGKLFVAEDPKDGGTQLYRLLIFNEHEVRQVAHHLRRTSK